jgi:hypothetical protein
MRSITRLVSAPQAHAREFIHPNLVIVCRQHESRKLKRKYLYHIVEERPAKAVRIDENFIDRIQTLQELGRRELYNNNNNKNFPHSIFERRQTEEARTRPSSSSGYPETNWMSSPPV